MWGIPDPVGDAGYICEQLFPVIPAAAIIFRLVFWGTVGRRFAAQSIEKKFDRIMEEMEKSRSDKTDGEGTLRTPAPKCSFRAAFFEGSALLDVVNGHVRDRWMLLHLALISIILFVVPIFFIELYGGDEPRVAGIAAEMAVENDWLIPRLNGTPFWNIRRFFMPRQRRVSVFSALPPLPRNFRRRFRRRLGC